MTGRTYRFGDFQRELTAGRNEVSMDELIYLPERDSEGRLIPRPPPRIQLNSLEVVRLLQPYISVRFLEQVRAVVPLALYLALFQILFLRQTVEDSWLITGGLFAVIVGLMLFMEALKRGLMPFGTVIGSNLPRKSPLPLVLFITLPLGIGVTFAEPAIGALKAAGQNVSVERAPYLFALLNQWADALVLVVGASVGLAAVIGTLRFLYGWSLKPLIYVSLLPVLALTVYCALDPQLYKLIGLAWDCGAVTTGPVTVPLVLAVGLGFGNATHAIEGFGILCMASIGPIITVLITGLWSRHKAGKQTAAALHTASTSHEQEAQVLL